MTIAIAALCNTDGKTQTGNIIVAADTLVSYSEVSSNKSASKLFDLPHGFFCLIAGNISKCHEFACILYGQMSHIEYSDNMFVELVKQAIDAALGYVRKWTRREILAEANVTAEEFLHDAALHCRLALEERLKVASFSFECIVAGFDADGSPILFQANCIAIQQQPSPGFFCIGSGSPTALDWLNFREQNCFMSTQRTYYHVREAINYAQLSNAVGETVNMLLLRHGVSYVDIGRLSPLTEHWVKHHYPRLTSDLDSADAWKAFAVEYNINPAMPANQK